MTLRYWMHSRAIYSLALHSYAVCEHNRGLGKWFAQCHLMQHAMARKASI